MDRRIGWTPAPAPPVAESYCTNEREAAAVHRAMGGGQQGHLVLSVIVCSPHVVKSHLSVQGAVYLTG